MINLGNKLKCNLRSVDAEEYYEKKLEKTREQCETLKKSIEVENSGIAFVSFKDRDCVLDTIAEIETVKPKLMGR